jgi:hypothetical protein
MMTRADKVLVVLAVAALPFLYIAYWGETTRGDAVRIYAPGQRPSVVSLDRDRELTVTGPLGPSVLQIKDGKVRFVSSPCRNKLCVHSGWLSRGGEFAACLPNHISIVVLAQQQRYDAINF